MTITNFIIGNLLYLCNYTFLQLSAEFFMYCSYFQLNERPNIIDSYSANSLYCSSEEDSSAFLRQSVGRFSRAERQNSLCAYLGHISAYRNRARRLRIAVRFIYDLLESGVPPHRLFFSAGWLLSRLVADGRAKIAVN